MSKLTRFISNRIKSIGYAFKGAILLITTEASAKVQLLITLVMTAAGFYYDLSSTEWIAQILVIGGVLTAEGLNTAIEKLSDFVHPDKNKEIGLIKDLSAGAVFIMAITAVIIGGIIYIPKMF